MPRKARLVIPNLPHHIVQRGNFQAKIFDEEKDKQFYINSFWEYIELFKIKVYSWCLMPNHVHFVLEPQNEKSLSLLFKSLNVKYSHYLNKKRGLKGQLWESRFYSAPLDDIHFKNSVRYVDLNPYRANLEKTIGQYKWSSAHQRVNNLNSKLSPPPTWFNFKTWKLFLEEQLEDKNTNELIRKHTFKNLPLGSKEFINKLSNITGRNLTYRDRGGQKRS